MTSYPTIFSEIHYSRYPYEQKMCPYPRSFFLNARIYVWVENTKDNQALRKIEDLLVTQ